MPKYGVALFYYGKGVKTVYYLILITLFSLLFIVLFREEKGKEDFFWAKIIILFLTLILTLEIGLVRIPLGIIIAFFLTAKFSKANLSLKRLTLCFSLAAFVLVNYITPPIQFNEILYSKEIYEQMNRFEEIEYVKVFATDADIQEKIKKYERNSSYIIFLTYTLMDKDIPIKDKDWLLYDSNNELDFYWQSNGLGSETLKTSETSAIEYNTAWMEYVRFNDTGEEYIGYFENKNGELFLKYVIKGKIKPDHKPESLF